jgi:hypothetical protein
VIEFNINAKWADRETVTFDYGIPAELFMGKRKGGPRQPLRYRRFATAAEAIRFAVEELPAVGALGAGMQVGDQRFDGDDIQRLYESNDSHCNGVRRINRVAADCPPMLMSTFTQSSYGHFERRLLFASHASSATEVKHSSLSRAQGLLTESAAANQLC